MVAVSTSAAVTARRSLNYVRHRWHSRRFADLVPLTVVAITLGIAWTRQLPVTMNVIVDPSKKNHQLRDSSSEDHVAGKNGVTPPSLFPPQCTQADLDIIRHQLPSTECIETAKKPWENRCSFSYATRCPDAVWLTAFYQNQRKTKTQATPSHKVQAVYVGCNKAMDAVNTLRMISGNATIDRDVWRAAFFESTSQTFEAGRCSQENAAQFVVSSSLSSQRHNPRAIVHCIEAMPVTASHLNRTAQKLQWQSQLLVRNMAMADTDGTILFPNVDKIGVENKGIDNCKQHKAVSAQCQAVPLLRLDTYMKQQETEQPSVIDFLSIDVEGFDYPVLLGAPESLPRIRYLEFEYNWKGPWRDYALSTAVAMLKDAGFVCYWPGAFGHIWRITDCWLDYHDLKFWSNIACVNVNMKDHPAKSGTGSRPWIARRMEDLFQQPLKDGGRKIHYSNVDTANTDGGWRAASTARV